ncbi:MAG TPA: type 1 glutamine amidotransferase [Nevskiaceae bacterium]|nr:type 1 glutamine amidotransferase [Nevskiaceae bacterium]
MRVHWLQHAEFEGLGGLAPWLAAREIEPRCTRLQRGEALPEDPAAIDLLVVMGGPMNVDDEARHPWLRAEKRFIEAALAAGVQVLGICLGAQLLARVLGAAVRPNPVPEIGWFEVERTAAGQSHPWFAEWPDRTAVFHWHGDRFELPAGCQTLLRSAACDHQAFAVGEQILALQFHPEVTAAEVALWLRHETPTPAPTVQTAAQMLAPLADYAAGQRRLDALMQRFCGPAVALRP